MDVDALTPAQQATLSLLVNHRRGYGDIARMLAGDPASIRDRAHEAVTTLMGRPAVDDTERALIDCALGQMPAAEADALAREVAKHVVSRRFAAEVAGVLRAFTAPGSPELVPLEVAAPEPVVAEAAVSEVMVSAGATPEAVASEVVPVRVLAAQIVPAKRRQRSPVVSPRTTAMLSLGLGSIVAGGFLFINGAH